MWNVKIITHIKEEKEAEKQRDSPSSSAESDILVINKRCKSLPPDDFTNMLKMRNVGKKGDSKR